MTDRELDAMMQRVLLDSIRHEWSKDLEWKSGFTPSAKYKHEIKAMLADPLAWERGRTTPVWKKAARWAAVVLLVISLGCGGLIAASPTVRAAFVQRVTEWYETHITYRYTGADTVEAMPRYEITELPEGYAEVESERIEQPGQADIVYRNESTGKTIYLDYIQMSQGAAIDFVITEDLDVIPITVNGLEGQFFGTADWERSWNTVTWIDPDSGLQFSIDANLDKPDILHIAESVSLAESTK